MSRIFYVNGDFVAEQDAKISVLDRGFLFADAVYEVSTVLGGKLIDNKAHLRRLRRSLSELSMAAPCSDKDIIEAQEKLLELNELDEGILYLQVSRGVADREFYFPTNTPSSLVMFTQSKVLVDNPAAQTGIKIITVPDQRWARRDIKTVGLLAPCLGKQAAIDAGVNDAWMVQDGLITEGSSNNAYIVNDKKQIKTRQLGPEILSGITRDAVLRFAKESGYTVVEEAFSVDEAKHAEEAFITSASTFVLPVVNIDDVDIGAGKPGPVATELRQIYIETALSRQEL